MRNLISVTLLLTTLAAPALAQVSMSNGSQTTVVNGPTTPAPSVQPGATQDGGTTTTQPTIQPQMPTSTNPPGSSPTAAPVAGASPGVPVLNAPAKQAAPSPAP